MVSGAIGSVRSAWSCDGVNPNGLLSQAEKADARTAIVSARLMLGGFIIGGATHIRFSRALVAPNFFPYREGRSASETRSGGHTRSFRAFIIETERLLRASGRFRGRLDFLYG